MKRIAWTASLLVVLAACSTSAQQADDAATESAKKSPKPSQSSSQDPSPASSATPNQSAASTTKPAQTQASASDSAFCDYLQRTQAARATVEDPNEYVVLVEGAQSVAPGAISDDLALYVESTRKMALTITGSSSQARKAETWLVNNEGSVATARENLNSYAVSTCGQPFLPGETG